MNHSIIVKVKDDGTPHCDPQEPHVQPGDTLTWQGMQHNGEFQGKILGDKQSGFAEADLPYLQVDATNRPVTPVKWDSLSSTLTIGDDAERGAYKYSVTVAGKTLDPVIIID